MAPKKSDAKKYKYTIQLQNPGAGDTGFILEGPRRCVPCDLSHDKVREMSCYLVLDEETIADACVGLAKKIKVTVTISKV